MDLKARRAERERLEKARAEREAQSEAQAAQKSEAQACQRQAEARSIFFKHGGAAQAEVWLIASTMYQEKASQTARIAEEKQETAAVSAAEARKEHGRAIERKGLVEKRLKAATRAIDERAHTLEDEATQERRR